MAFYTKFKFENNINKAKKDELIESLILAPPGTPLYRVNSKNDSFFFFSFYVFIHDSFLGLVLVTVKLLLPVSNSCLHFLNTPGRNSTFLELIPLSDESFVNIIQLLRHHNV